MTPEFIDKHLSISPSVEYVDNVKGWECEVRWKGNIVNTFFPPLFGHTRSLFYFLHQNKKYIVKVDRHEDFSQCPEEIDVWNNIKRYHRKYFVPILHGSMGKGVGPGWVVVPYIHNLGIHPAKPRHYKTIERLEDYYDLADMRVNNNWFIVSNAPLIVDYGVRPWM